jgi:hypothetical protein
MKKVTSAGSELTTEPKRRLTPERLEYLQNTAEEVINLMETKGYSMFKACKQIGIPHNSFLDFIDKDERLIDKYTRAISIKSDIKNEQLTKIAANRANDFYTDQDGNIRPNPVAVQRDRLLIDTLKWQLSKEAPRKYGDRINIDAKIEHTQPLSIDQVNDILKQLDSNTIDITDQQE